MTKVPLIFLKPPSAILNPGETITLRDSQGNKIDEVSYGNEFPWSIAADGEGASLELIHPLLDNDLAGSWRPSGYQAGVDPEAAFGQLAASAGLTGTDLPSEMAFINEVLDALPDELCNIFLVNYFNDLYV